MDRRRLMTLSVRLDPELDARVAAESRQRGVTKSEVVKDALERVLGLKNPLRLLDQVRSAKPMRRHRGLDRDRHRAEGKAACEAFFLPLARTSHCPHRTTISVRAFTRS
jgi:hypothetical protein